MIHSLEVIEAGMPLHGTFKHHASELCIAAEDSSVHDAGTAFQERCDIAARWR
jgi:hypothetical protein